jgi:hypothetical protein
MAQIARLLKKDEDDVENVYAVGMNIRRERTTSKDNPEMDKFAGAPAPPREVYKGVAAQMAEEHMPLVIDGSASPTKTRSADKDPIVNMNAPGLPPKKSEWMAPQGAGWAPAGWGEGAGEAAYPVAASDASSDMESKPSSGEDVDALLSMRSSSSSLRGLEESLRAERKRNVVAEAKLQSYEQELRKLRETEKAAAVEAAGLKAKLEATEAALERSEKDRNVLQQALLSRK